jgi:AcrR family transcriptional regulator
MEIPKRIITQAENLFKARGIRGVTMDDIATNLGMSKKTLYQYFKNKADIVHQVTLAHFDIEICQMVSASEIAKDPVEEMVLILKSISKTFSDIPASMIYEVQKYYPKSWGLFHEFKNAHMVEAVRKNLESGRKQGLYRKDFDLQIVTKIRIEQVLMVFDPSHFPPSEFDLTKVQIEMFSLFLHGLVTEKGKTLLYQYLKTAENEA